MIQNPLIKQYFSSPAADRTCPARRRHRVRHRRQTARKSVISSLFSPLRARIPLPVRPAAFELRRVCVQIISCQQSSRKFEGRVEKFVSTRFGVLFVDFSPIPFDASRWLDFVVVQNLFCKSSVTFASFRFVFSHFCSSYDLPRAVSRTLGVNLHVRKKSPVFRREAGTGREGNHQCVHVEMCFELAALLFQAAVEGGATTLSC